MHYFSKNTLPKTGLLIGVILGSALVSQVGDALNHVTVRDIWKTDNGAAVIQSLNRNVSLMQQFKFVPRLGSIIGATEIFSWEPVSGASDYRLSIGTYKGGLDIAHVYTGSDTISIVDGIPQDGGPVYVQLSYKLNGVEGHFDVPYTTDRIVSDSDQVSASAQPNPFNPPKKSIKR